MAALGASDGDAEGVKVGKVDAVSVQQQHGQATVRQRVKERLCGAVGKIVV